MGLQADVESVVSMCSADNVHELLAGKPDFVLDAIDNIHTKVWMPILLFQHAQRCLHKQPAKVFSEGGDSSEPSLTKTVCL